MAIRFVEVGLAGAEPAGAPPEVPQPRPEGGDEPAADGNDPPAPAATERTTAPPEPAAPLLDPLLFPEVARERRAGPKPRRNRRGFG